MPRKNAGAEEARDLRGALVAVGNIIDRHGITPKGKLQQIAGLLSVYDIVAALPATSATAMADAPLLAMVGQ